MNDRAMQGLLARDAQSALGRVHDAMPRMLRSARALMLAGPGAGRVDVGVHRIPSWQAGSQGHPGGGAGDAGQDLARIARAGEVVTNRRTLRAGCTGSQVMAHNILDRVAAGEQIALATINRALTTLGDA